MKLSGKPTTGKPYGGFDVAGDGNGVGNNNRAIARPYLRGASPGQLGDAYSTCWVHEKKSSFLEARPPKKELSCV